MSKNESLFKWLLTSQFVHIKKVHCLVEMVRFRGISIVIDLM